MIRVEGEIKHDCNTVDNNVKYTLKKRFGNIPIFLESTNEIQEMKSFLF